MRADQTLTRYRDLGLQLPMGSEVPGGRSGARKSKRPPMPWSVGKFQLPHHRLKARLIAQGVQERVGLHELKSRVAQAHRRVKPFERFGAIAPLRVDRDVLV